MSRLLRIGLCCLAATPGLQAASDGNLGAAMQTEIDALFESHDRPDSPGCAVGVMRDGELAYARGYGMADIERGVPITPSTLFDVASTSKQFAAAAIVLLAQDGKLELADDVREYVPELPDYGAPITIDHLLRHTSGLRDYNALLVLAGHDYVDVVTDAQALAIIERQQALNFPTGSRYEYSNTGYFLLSVIVERVSGKTLAQFARERIFLPLEMTETRYRDDYAMLIPGRALGYSGNTADGFRISMSNWEPTGDGALHISIEEALKWDENFYRPEVGGEKLVDLLTETGTLSSGEPIDYARGLIVDRYRGLKRVHHGGSWIGYRTGMERYPEQHTSIAVFCNSDDIRAVSLSHRIADIVLADAFREPKAAPSAQSEASPGDAVGEPLQTEQFVGSYFDETSNTVYGIDAEDGTLVLKLTGLSLPLTATGSDTFRLRDYPATVAFARAEPGRAESLQLTFESEPATTAIRFAPATPDASELRSYTGRFYSVELDVTWRVVVEDGGLKIRMPARTLQIAGTLEPAMTDSFHGEIGFLRFDHDAAGRVTGFELSASRMSGIRFRRAVPIGH